MTVLTNIWHDLIEKKLWLVALGLLAMLVAAPTLLGKPGEIPAPPPAPQVAATDLGPSLALTPTGATGFARAARVNKRAVDPFANRGKVDTTAVSEDIANAVDAITSGGDDTTDTNPTGPTDNTPTTDDPKPTTPKKAKTEKDDLLTVMIQQPGGEPTELADIRTLSPLPDADNPFLVYVGKAGGGKASFLVSSTAAIQAGSQGNCAPSLADCRTLELEIGDTATFLVTSATADGGTEQAMVSITYVDMETKRVSVNADDTVSGRAADLEHSARVVGARALKSVAKDEAVLQSLARQKIKFRH